MRYDRCGVVGCVAMLTLLALSGSIVFVAVASAEEGAGKTANMKATAYEIRGRCVDSAGQPVVDAEVQLLQTDFTDEAPVIAGKLRTNAKGEFAFTDLEPPTSEPPTKQRHYHVAASHPKLASAFTWFHDREQPNNRELVLAKNPGALIGRITNELGEPLVGADVFVAFADGHPIPGVMHAVTDDDGRYVIDDVRQWDSSDRNSVTPFGFPGGGSCAFRVRHPSYPLTLGSFRAVPSQADVKVPLGITVKGRVIDTLTGQPAQGAIVQAQGLVRHGWATVTTDDDGRYRFTVLDDKYNIRALAQDRISVAIASFSGRVGDSIEAPELKLIAGGYVTGKLVDPFLKLPVSRLANGFRIPIGHYGPAYPKPGAAVGATKVNDDGTYRLHVAPGSNRVYIMVAGIEVSRSGPGAVDRTGVTVRDGETVTLDFEVDVSKARFD